MQPEIDPDGGWVARLSDRSAAEADSAIAEARNETRIYSYLARQHAREGRESYIEIDAPLELYALVRLMQPDHVVEVGVSSGVSSAYLLGALERNGSGRLHSVDLPSHEAPSRAHRKRTRFSWSLPPGRATGWAVPPRLRRGWDLRLGDKADVLPLLAEQLPSIGLFVYDVPHECGATFRELERLDPLLGPHAVVIIDHGPGGNLCPALARWARRGNSEPSRREGLGLFGARRAGSRRSVS
ncbi:MAG TPA: class I SAM-dependent methyltransferase [Thermoplasmata archaeon]|nr:class I SAM-dependent methyltransferase [Thermoplasmata archaeon]